MTVSAVLSATGKVVAEGLVFVINSTLPLVERFFIACYTHRCLVKRSQALRGRNLTRDNHADGAPMVHQAGDNKLPEAFLMYPSDTGAMPQKIPDLGQSPRPI